jgi:hypothetical protein
VASLLKRFSAKTDRAKEMLSVPTIFYETTGFLINDQMALLGTGSTLLYIGFVFILTSRDYPALIGNL